MKYVQTHTRMVLPLCLCLWFWSEGFVVWMLPLCTTSHTAKATELIQLSCSVEQILGAERKLHHIETETTTSSYRYTFFYSSDLIQTQTNLFAKTLVCCWSPQKPAFALIFWTSSSGHPAAADSSEVTWPDAVLSGCFWDWTFLPLHLHLYTLLFLPSVTLLWNFLLLTSDLTVQMTSDDFKGSPQRLLWIDAAALKSQKVLLVNVCFCPAAFGLVFALLFRS